MLKPTFKLQTQNKNKKDIKRQFFIDKYNNKKVWEVAHLKGGYLLRQYLKNIDGTYYLFNKGSRRTQKELIELGVLSFEEITNKTILLEGDESITREFEIKKKEGVLEDEWDMEI